MSEYITPTNALLAGAGALIIVLAYMLVQQRKDARNGKRMRKSVIKAVVEMGCKHKGDKIVCPKPLAGLGDSFKVDDAITRSLDQFCALIREKDEPAPPAHSQPSIHQMAQQGFHDMPRAPMPTAMAMPAMPIPGVGGMPMMPQGMPYMPPQPQQPMMQPGFAGAFAPVTGEGMGGGMMGSGDAPKPLPFQPISTREDRNMPMAPAVGGMAPSQYNPSVF
ncbi:hypothetical protein [Medusavirus stheno T3]|uniref:Uncharacterized protein n=1 Tax=Medusavirus stheno T3 TaxID=3069717 RepID=A0A7S7YF23_9VIRU|nr:hypothetical protein QKU73_gp190 [Acanthamoeba castellanii medusavirus]QPB44585.1 hypothetical protein [Medusavirus stheno T3]